MAREKVRKAAEVMMAYADGKEIEFKEFKDEKWRSFIHKKDNFLYFDFNQFEYRIKKEPTYRPFKDMNECWNEMQKHQPFGWAQEKNSKTYVFANKIGGCPDGVNGLDYSKMFHYFNFADGTPFGVKEE